jgi:hypothetical protein
MDDYYTVCSKQQYTVASQSCSGHSFRICKPPPQFYTESLLDIEQDSLNAHKKRALSALKNYKPRTIVPISEQGQCIKVTDYSLAHWLAQTYQIDINNWPINRPEHISKEAYEQLKKILRKHSNRGIDTSIQSLIAQLEKLQPKIPQQ